jgi:kynurenine 3-monooxygenase
MPGASGRTFTIFGAGLAGGLMAVLLARRGHRVELYERRPDPRTANAERGRSINLALSTRGIHALGQAGIAERILSGAIPMRGRMIHPREGDLAFQPYSRNPDHFINSISRAGLNIKLLNAAEGMPGVRVHFGQRCLGMDFDSGRAEVQDWRTGEVRAVETDTVIGADGAFSGVRGSMQKRDRFEYDQSYLPHGYKELTIPPGPDGSWRIQKNALHIWPRGTYMMIALPNGDGSFTCTLFWPFEGPNSFSALRSEVDIQAFFEDQFPDAVPLIPDLARDFRTNPTSSLVTVRCWPWHVGDRAVLVGDAAHAVVPFSGQGMNASFEDCVTLATCLDEHGKNLADAYSAYAELRKENTDALARLAVENFIEMRDKAGSPAFRRKKALEHALEDWFPNWYQSLYAMVTFSTIPYADAVERAREQDALVHRIGIGAVLGLAAIVGVWLVLRTLNVF